MSRIKKRGLDYFPLNTDFLHGRLVRRILKREGDAALAVLLQTLCSIYSGEGYYVVADRLFYDDLSDCLYQQEAADVERILALAVEYGLFDATLFAQYHILTSADIHQQYLFIIKRRNCNLIDERYNLLPAEKCEATEEEKCDKNEENGAETHINETFRAENDEKAYQSTQTKEKKSIENKRKENLLLHSSPQIGGTPNAAPRAADEDAPSAEDDLLSERACDNAKTPRRQWSDDDIARLTPPTDGQSRNADGLVYNLRQFRIPPAEQYAILLKSNFGIIGHPVWKGFCTLRESHGKIRQPGRYLLSLCCK